MNRYVKYGLIGIAILAALFALLLAVIAFTVNPNDFKPQIISLVKEKKQRTLSLPGDIKLALFPKLGIDLGKATLSEHESPAEFAAVDHLRLYVAWLPLLKKELVVDQVSVDGLKANLVRYKNGTTNYDDLLSPEKSEEGQQVKFDVQGVQITHANLSYDDQQAGRRLQISDLDFESGRLRNATPTKIDLSARVRMNQPQVDAQAKIKTGLLFDLDAKHYALDGLEGKVTGAALGISGLEVSLAGDADARPETGEFQGKDLKVSIRGKQGGNDLQATLDAPSVQLTKEKVTSGRVVLDGTVDQPKGKLKVHLVVPNLEGTGKAFKAGLFTLDVEGSQEGKGIKASLASPLSGNLDAQRVELPDLKGNLEMTDPHLPGGRLQASLAGNVQADLKAQRVSANLAGKLDQSNMKAKLGMEHFSSPAYSFDVAIDQLDVDRYLPPKPAGGGSKQGAEPEKPMDFSALKKLNASGEVRIGSLKVSNIKSSNVVLRIKAADSRLTVNPLSANLYQGTMNGSLSVAAAATPRIALKQRLSGIDIGPLLKDALNKDMLEGRGTLNLDVDTAGDTVSAMKRALNGTAAVNLVDGAIKGINVAAALRNAKAQLGSLRGEQTQAASAAEKTDFSELRASFNIRNGVAHNDDLYAKSPLLRLGGSGDVNLGTDSLDYLAKATVVGTLEGQGGKDLASLRGVTVPIRLSGPFTALKYTLDFNALAQEAVKGKIEEKKEEIRTRVQDQLQDKLKGLFR